MPHVFFVLIVPYFLFYCLLLCSIFLVYHFNSLVIYFIVYIIFLVTALAIMINMLIYTV